MNNIEFVSLLLTAPVSADEIDFSEADLVDLTDDLTEVA